MQQFVKMVSTREKKIQQKKQLSQLNGILNDFIIGNGTNLSAMQNETLEQQTNGPNNDLEKFVGSSSQNQVKENNIDDKIRRAVDNAVLTVGNCMHDAILTAMDKVVIPRFESAVISITGSIGHAPNSDVQIPDRRDFLGNTGKTPLMSTSSRLDLNTNQDRNDGTRDKDFEDGDFPALRHSYDRRAPTHHNLSVRTYREILGKMFETEVRRAQHSQNVGLNTVLREYK